jgi:hypothetical protein
MIDSMTLSRIFYKARGWFVDMKVSKISNNTLFIIDNMTFLKINVKLQIYILIAQIEKNFFMLN